MKLILYISLILFSFGFQNTQEANDKLIYQDKIQKTVKTSFWVNGVCDMCQNRIQKAALNTKGVKMANWVIKTKILTVIYSDKKCSVDQIKKNLAKAGHDTVDYKATSEDYDNLRINEHAGTKKFSNYFSVYLGGENLSNYTQENPILGSSNPFGSTFDSSMIYAPVHGRTFYIGLRYKIKKREEHFDGDNHDNN